MKSGLLKRLLYLERKLKESYQLNDNFENIQISIASPKTILKWCTRYSPNRSVVGKISQASTLNFKTYLPEEGGFFCEKIFGPLRSWKCNCQKYIGPSSIRYFSDGYRLKKMCETCESELTDSRVRRYRLGYIKLNAPIAHYWYFKGAPNYFYHFLKGIEPEIKVTEIENLIYLKEGQPILPPEFYRINEKFFPKIPFYDNSENLLNHPEIYQLRKKYNTILSTVEELKRKGSDILLAALKSINLSFAVSSLRQEVMSSTVPREIDFTIERVISEYKQQIRTLRILESFNSAGIDPAWMILTVIPVLPPTLRPIIEIQNGQLIVSDLNEHYRHLYNRNMSCAKMEPIRVTLNNGLKNLQYSVDILIDNSRVPKKIQALLNDKPLKSLTEILEGKEGRFRHTLLGKRVDYSGRSIIVINPNLNLNYCGLPYQIARELFEPILLNRLLKTIFEPPFLNTKLAYIIIKKNKPFVWRLLYELIPEFSVLLNRAPTLHKFGIQAFYPILVLGDAIHLNALVCTGFNADFDGDQMAVHLPLYEATQLEAQILMNPSCNIKSPANGDVIVKPTQDIVLGTYYLTLMLKNSKNFLAHCFANEFEAVLALENKKITIHTRIFVRYNISNFFIETSEKKIQFLENNEIFPFFTKKISIFKKVKMFSTIQFYYLLTNIGIIIAKHLVENKYEMTTILVETTPGRIIFKKNLEKTLVFKKKQ